MEETLHTWVSALHPAGDWRGHSLGGDHPRRRRCAGRRRFAAGCCWMRRCSSPARALDLAWQIVANGRRITGRRGACAANWRTPTARCGTLPARRCLPSFRRRALRDYIEHGADASEHGVRLRFQPQIEGRDSPPCRIALCRLSRSAWRYGAMWRAAATGVIAPAMRLPAGVLV